MPRTLSHLFAYALALALPVLSSIACSSDESSNPGANENEYLGLKPPPNGFQVRSVGATIQPGEDVEYCEVAELPGTPDQVYYVNAIEYGNARGSHHLNIFVAEPGSASDLRLRALNVGDRVVCLSAQSAFGEGGMNVIGGIQQPYGHDDFPDGVGVKCSGGQRVVFEYHVLNTTGAPIEARSAFNFHLTDETAVQHIASSFYFWNFTIDTPPGQTRSFTAECNFDRDVMVSRLTRHTHRWGADYSVWFEAGSRNGEHIWTSKDWEHEVNYTFAVPVLLQAGEGFRFECNYNNTEAHALRFGTNATDEMCVLNGLLWDPLNKQEVTSQNCDISWVDDQKLGHEAGDGAFPKASAEEAKLCIENSVDPVASSECIQCRCDSCAHVYIQCATDPDCSKIWECVRAQTDRLAVPSPCQDVTDEHSSALGLMKQIEGCSKANLCASCPQ
jgi:hypothetical protein